MTSDALSREQDLFCGCVVLAPGERDSWLAEACSDDPRLRERIQRLLRAHEAAERSDVAGDADWGRPMLPEAIDGYRIVRILGEGGMGVVYEAMQEHPVRRRVALKAIQPGMDTRQVIARFLTERQALAAMDHPYVAKIFDAGETPAGHPYFVMEYVEGKAIVDYCRDNRLTLRQRISLFVLVCQAAQHAHHKGVIHRDLKPGNVLVTGEFAAPIPKVIDFGIARAMGEGIRPDATLTSAGWGPGTPAYMSPEQAGYAGLDVDTRSDVYSLGVILYELLTGALPADPDELSWPEFRRRLAAGDLEIAAPSRRAARNPDSPARPGELAGDLDLIVLKALETDRERRYDTALALADDLQRFLSCRMVTARPPTLRYRASRYYRRHRASVIAACLAAAVLLIGVAAGALGLRRATRAEAAALQEAETARQISAFLTGLFTASDPNRPPGSPVTVKDVLDQATVRVQSELARAPEAQAALMGTLSHVQESMGSYRQARELAERSLAIHIGREDARTAETLVSLGRVRHRLGDFDGARGALQRAIDIRVRLLGENSLEVAEALNLLGGVEGQVERFAEAEAAHRRALAIQERLRGFSHIATYNSWRGLAMVYDRQGRYSEALECFRRVLPIAQQRFGAAHPVVADALHNIAMELDELGRPDEAEKMFAECVEMRRSLLGPNHPSVAFSVSGLAQVYRKQGRLREALPLYEEAARIRAAALGSDNVRTWESRKSVALVRMGLGDVAGGYQLLQQAIAAIEKAYGPTHTDVLAAHRDAGIALVKAARYREAVPHLRRVTGGDVPSKVRVSLEDPVFAGMRHSKTFAELTSAERSGR